NIGTGQQISINRVANTLAKYINPDIKPIITNKFRPGDIRHCYPDIKKIKNLLGYEPKYLFDDGMKELIEWVKIQAIPKDKSLKANEELKKKGLL
ncbi:MAG: nucleoside-diphosphate-sugar epimerase, partial [archaeon]|nr:nucleoside-diphosphate-sugar epimerase [archaeon]